MKSVKENQMRRSRMANAQSRCGASDVQKNALFIACAVHIRNAAGSIVIVRITVHIGDAAGAVIFCIVSQTVHVI